MNTLLDRLKLRFVFETPDVTSAPSSATPAAPAAPAVGQPVTASGPDQATNEGFWALFPNVPVEQREILAPHIKGMQGHITQLQQRYSPFKDYDDDGIKGLAAFSEHFDSNPLEAWLNLGRQLQDGELVHGDLDLDALSRYAAGNFEDVPEEGEPQVPGVEEEVPAWAQPWIAEQEAQKQQREQEAQAREQAAQDARYDAALKTITSDLEKAGYPLELLGPDEESQQRFLAAQMIVNNGDGAAISKALIDQRTATLKGLVDKNNDPNAPTVRNGGPQARPKAPSGRRAPRDGFEAASNKAEQYLQQQLRGGAQE